MAVVVAVTPALLLCCAGPTGHVLAPSGAYAFALCLLCADEEGASLEGSSPAYRLSSVPLGDLSIACLPRTTILWDLRAMGGGRRAGSEP